MAVRERGTAHEFHYDTDGDGCRSPRAGAHRIRLRDSHHALHDFVGPDGDLIFANPFSTTARLRRRMARYVSRTVAGFVSSRASTSSPALVPTTAPIVTFDDWGQHGELSDLRPSFCSTRFTLRHPRPAGLRAYSGTGTGVCGLRLVAQGEQGGYVSALQADNRGFNEKTEFGYDEEYVGDIIFSIT